MTKVNNEKNFGLSRRSLLKSGAQIAGASVLPAFMARNAFAENFPAIGSYPAGSAGPSVFIGLTTPLTGTYAAQGVDERKGFELAVEHLNSGNPLMKKYSPLTSKGVLGKQVTLGVADSEAKPNTAVQAQSRFISENKAVLIAGCVSSAVAVALNKLAMREKVIYLPGISGSNDTTGHDCARYSFRECHYAYTAANALAPQLIAAFGKNKKVAFLTPDYTYGHSVTGSMQEFLKPAGWTTVTDQVAPLGTPDYNTYLLNIANSGADVLINVNFGNDAVNSIKQANQLGLLQKMKLVMPYISPFLSKQAGPDLMAGVYGTTEWWWTLADTNDMAKMFVEAFKAKNGYTPEWGAHAGYVQVALWADAVENAKTFYPPEVIKSYESGRKIMTDMGEVSWRAEDHQLIRPVYIVRGKPAKEMKNADDYFEIVKTVDGASVMQKPDAFGCKLGSAT